VSGERLGRALDVASRGWWRLAGRRVDLDGGRRWLDGPVCGPGPVGASWLGAGAGRLGGLVREDVPGGGLLRSMSVLDGAGFRAAGRHRGSVVSSMTMTKRRNDRKHLRQPV